MLERLAAVIDELVALDETAVVDDQLAALVTGLQRERARLGAATGRLLTRWHESGMWADDGSRTCAGRLARETHTSVSTAKAELRRARHLVAMPDVASAIVAGRLSLDHLDVLGRAARAPGFAAAEAMLVEHCATLRFADAAKVIAYWSQQADHDPGPDDRSVLHASTTWQGHVVVDAVLEPIGGRIFLDELARHERDQYLADERAGTARTAARRRAAALVEMATRSANATGRRRPKPLFTVLVGDDRAHHLCELADGTVVTPERLSPWIGSAMLETVLFDGPTTVVSVSRRRSFVGAVRRAVEVRDRHCRHPSGCDVPASGCDVDHVVPYADGGLTSQFNGRLECTTHNRHADRHDHDAAPRPERSVGRLDELRALIRFRTRRDYPDDDEPHDHTG